MKGVAPALRASAWTAGCVIRLRCETGPFRVARGLPEISRRSWEDWIWLYQEMSDGVRFEHAGNEFITHRGDLLLTDPTVPFSGQPRSAHDYRRWIVPRAWIADTLWPDGNPEAALRTLRRTVYDLRGALAGQAWRLAGDGRNTLWLDLTVADVDVLDFDAALTQFRNDVAIGVVFVFVRYGRR